MKPAKFSIAKRLKSFTFAFNGLKILFKEQYNARIHLLAIVVVVIAGAWFKLTASEWIAITFAIGLVIAMEIINTAIEQIADFMTTEQNPKIKKIKDLASAGVLVSAITAVIIALLVFIPKIHF